jgi:hypothetical protein
MSLSRRERLRPLVLLGVVAVVVTACHGPTSTSAASPPAASAVASSAAVGSSSGAAASSPAAQVTSSAPTSPAASAPPAASPIGSPATSTVVSPSASASASTSQPMPAASGPLTLFANVKIAGAFGAAQNEPVAAEGPDGAVFVAGAPTTPQIIWVVDGVRPATIAEHVAGPVTALAADAGNLYVGVGHTVSAYSRTTGNLVRSWTPAAMPGGVSQLVLAGNRLWGLFTATDDNAPSVTGVAGGLVEIDPSSTTIVRTVAGITGAFSIAGGPSGVYYVTKQSSELVERTNDGRTVNAPTKQQVDLELSGPSAIQAIAVSGETVLVQHDAGQGLDAELDSYDATTLAGPSNQTGFSANEQLIATPSGLFVVGNPDTEVCANGQTQCLDRFALSTGPVGSAIALPADALATTGIGPYPAVVVAEGSDLHVVRIS